MSTDVQTPQRQRISRMSSLLVATPVIVAAFVLGVLAGRFGLPGLSTVCLCLGLLGLVSRLWGTFAARRVTARIDADRPTLSVGEDVTVTYSLENGKLLPVMWLELLQDVPEAGRLTPDGGLTLVRYDATEAAAEGRESVYRRRVLFLMGMQQMSWDVAWTGRRRGIYQPKHLTIRTGDALGLTQSALDVATDALFVVWPEMVPVTPEPLLRSIWRGTTGRSGHVEDPSVMRGLRAYQPGDPWKRIDWRMAARQDELSVRQFETILPASLHFVLDVASFAGLSEDDAELERAISVLASLIAEFDRRGIACGLSLPPCDAGPGVDLFASDPAVAASDLLYELAVLDARGATGAFDDARLKDVAQTESDVLLVAHSAGRASCPDLIEALADEGLTLVAYAREDAEPPRGVRTMSLEQLAPRGDAA